MATVTHSNLKTSLGSLVIGSLAATALSGIVMMQGILYFRMFGKDHLGMKLIVSSIILLDLLHTAMLWTADWMYLVAGFGDMNITNHVFWSAGVSIALTAMTTVIVHFFFTYRLFRLSKGNYFITVPMAIIALLRVGSAFTTAGELKFLGVLHTLPLAVTLGLVLSTALDIMITSGLCIFLRKSRSSGNGSSGRLDHILNSMTLYTIETGMVTCIATAISLIFWLAKPHALIYLGLHFAISKFYANSFLASVNARKLLRAQHVSLSTSGSGALPPVFTNRFIRQSGVSVQPDTVDLTSSKLQITIDKTVDYATDDIPMSSTRTTRSNSATSPMEDVKAKV
ncbi:uncharacterized protein B0H18DRAFT_1121607 [Fomitopsis serialis]|uniref:uncharacterized protein n=1 Tax=Fomitopsis serialis TaxID=139415 RepID=UPI002007DC6F|nr:uncharacterized protein B0H18DRAFT_1121607 [Neoantrodia serialis]KAH9921039.1 hypothetical protein B0H18DRAFT_1121607 [Neoantrodia serialis]